MVLFDMTAFWYCYDCKCIPTSKFWIFI